jgi:HPt (histidine-containing phosphotransfer) domain-containing protein
MNHFATKPITAARLAEAIDAVTIGRRPIAELAAGRTRHAGGPGAPVENRTFDPAVLDELVRELGADVAAEVVRMFIDKSGQELATIRERLAMGATADVARLAHAMANTARSVGLLRLARAAADISIGAVAAEQVGAVETLLWTGIEELRMWRP